MKARKEATFPLIQESMPGCSAIFKDQVSLDLVPDPRPEEECAQLSQAMYPDSLASGVQ